MTLHLDSGDLSFDDGIAILSAGGTLAGLDRIHSANEIRHRDMGNGYAWHSFPSLFLQRRYLVDVCGFEGRVRSVHWQIPAEPSSLPWAWPSPEESEVQRLAMIQDLSTLVPGFDGKRAFPWGTLWTTFDRKGGFSSSGITYKTTLDRNDRESTYVGRDPGQP